MSTLRPEAAHRGHRERGSPRLCGGGEIQVNCRWWWLVALLIDKGVPLGEGRTPLGEGCAPPWVKGTPLGGFGDFSSSSEQVAEG
jgi:hypothetical protein